MDTFPDAVRALIRFLKSLPRHRSFLFEWKCADFSGIRTFANKLVLARPCLFFKFVCFPYWLYTYIHSIHNTHNVIHYWKNKSALIARIVKEFIPRDDFWKRKLYEIKPLRNGWRTWLLNVFLLLYTCR